MNPVAIFLNAVGQFTYVAFVIFMIVKAVVDGGVGLGFGMFVLGCFFYPAIARLFPLPGGQKG